MSKKVAYYGVFAALAILMGYVEAMVSIPLPLPGIKLGLSNAVVLLTLYVMGMRPALGISLVRVVISALLFKGMLSIWYSASGALLSFCVMALAYQTGKLSVCGVSILGGVFHNLGQIAAAWVLLGRGVVLYLTPVLMITGAVTGLFIGLVANYCLAHVKHRKN